MVASTVMDTDSPKAERVAEKPVKSKVNSFTNDLPMLGARERSFGQSTHR